MPRPIAARRSPGAAPARGAPAGALGHGACWSAACCRSRPGWRFAPLSSAVVAQAHVKVDLNRRPVQHAEGGIVREVLVRDGQRVRQGEPLAGAGRRVGRRRPEPARLPRQDRARQPGAARRRAAWRPRSSSRRTWSRPRQRPAPGRADGQGARAVRRAARCAGGPGRACCARSATRWREEIVALRAQIAQASESLKFQKAELETNRKLLKDGFISATRIAQLEGAVADYGVKIEERRAELARAAAAHGRCRPAHPLAGERLPPAGERPAEGHGGAARPRSSRSSASRSTPRRAR